MKFTFLILITSTLLVLPACSSTKISDYANTAPKLSPQEFFNGDLSAQGVLKNRSGKVTRHFTATIKASWKNNIGTLEEKFVFNDGEVQYRTWTLTPTQATAFTATAGDVIGTGKGKFMGNAINLNYVLAVKYKNSTINLTVDDWMWKVDDSTVLNESTLSKFGFKVGSIQLVMRKNQ